MTIRLGFVGLSAKGWASMMLAPPLLQPPLDSLYSLEAVSTTNADSAATSATKWSELAKRPVKSYYGPTSAIAADPELDLVVVAVNAPQHKLAAMPIIEAGKDIFVEWPVGKSLQETLEIAEAAKKKGIRSMVGAQGRQTPTIRKVSCQRGTLRCDSNDDTHPWIDQVYHRVWPDWTRPLIDLRKPTVLSRDDAR